MKFASDEFKGVTRGLQLCYIVRKAIDL